MKLQQVLQDRGVEYEEMVHPPVYTAQGLAATEHVSGHCVAKPVVVAGPKGFAMCVVPACSQLDLGRVGEVLGGQEVRLADEAELAKVCPDCELGAEPPIGSLFGLPTIMDESLTLEDYMVFQSGCHTECVRVSRKDFERIADPRIAPIGRA